MVGFEPTTPAIAGPDALATELTCTPRDRQTFSPRMGAPHSRSTDDGVALPYVTDLPPL